MLPNEKEILETGNAPSVNEEFVEGRARLIEETLASFGAPSQVVEINRGPAITQFGVEPLFVETRNGRTRVRVSKIVSLSDDLALALAAPRIRIQAPVPGRSYLGIEVPNNEMTLVTLREILEMDSFARSRKMLSFALGRDVSGHPIGQRHGDGTGVDGMGGLQFQRQVFLNDHRFRSCVQKFHQLSRRRRRDAIVRISTLSNARRVPRGANSRIFRNASMPAMSP